MGIKRMRKALADAKLEESTLDTNGFFRAVFYRPEGTPRAAGLENNWKELEGRLKEKLGENEGKILGIIFRNRRVTIFPGGRARFLRW